MPIIRNDQIKALAAAGRRDFVLRMMASLRNAVPSRCAGLSAPQLQAFVESSLEHALQYGVLTEHDAATFIMVHVLTSDDLSSGEAPSWATTPFQDLSKTPAERVQALLDAILAPGA
jgi:hypothetical protein